MILNRIIDIEKRAQEIAENAEQEKLDVFNRAEEECSRIAKDIEIRQKKRLEKVLEQERQNAGEKREEIRRQAAQKLDILESRYQEKKEDWIEEIYRGVIR